MKRQQKHWSDREIDAAAAEYVRQQLAIMKRHGHAPVLSSERRRQLIEEIAETTKAQRDAFLRVKQARQLVAPHDRHRRPR
jgi:hypothetical protein